ncbi:MAG: HNH endonuclease [Bdellovibrio sp.]|nr:HNH endonuclease [Bdellovibrio sp.]
MPLSKICGSTRFLQIDHRQPVWAGGTNEFQNLQVLCAQHNQYKYRQESFFI